MTAWFLMHSFSCLKAPRNPLSFFTVDGGGALDNGENMWLHGSQDWPVFFQPNIVVVSGAIINFFGLNVSPDKLALDRAVTNRWRRSSSLSASR